ncbi:transcription elongation factor Spt6 [Exidia glandulosa HHB12029]|uniref:Transcription elongation factor Spt6 n=1 Tax=Exidia glandulosa HHB12029 TaxID=1314781 RepID=A0A165EBY1_EXIGL|nr:transcription elongation factor Spt6 [Exidia glandulosa HHB12029]
MSDALADPHNAMDVDETVARESEGEGDVIPPTGNLDDSSEEEESDEEEERRVRDGFIVDEDDDDDGDDDDDVKRHKKRRKRRKHSRREEDGDDAEMLEDDDLDLLEENTGRRIERNPHQLTRLRRGRSQSPPGKQSKRASKSDRGNDIVADIWNDDDEGAIDADDDVQDDDDMGGFIDDDEDEDNALGEDERLALREEKRKKMRKVISGHDMIGIDRGAWDEITEVFGEGDDYDWALEGDDEGTEDPDMPKDELRLQDVFEPSEIKARLLTEDDDLIRGQDIPERMQLLTSSLSTTATLSLHPAFSFTDLNAAAEWVASRLGGRIVQEFYVPSGKHFRFLSHIIRAVRDALDMLLCQNLEVPYVWTHRRDSLCHFEVSIRVELLTLDELWRVYILGQRFRSLLERKRGLESLYERLAVHDRYYETDLRSKLETVEMVADTTEWLNMQYHDRKKDSLALQFHDTDPEQAAAEKKHKAPSRISAYEVLKKSVISKLAQGYGISPQEVVQNFASNAKLHFAVDQDVPPLEYAEQFIDPATPGSGNAKDILAKARMILATELGKDPILRHNIRELFKDHATVTVIPTEKGVSKIDDFHPYNAFKYLKDKPLKLMMTSSQYMHILRAETDLLVSIDIRLNSNAQEEFTSKLLEAFLSDNYSDTVKAWNDERELVVKEVMDNFLMPLGGKWVKEWAREEVEDHLANVCADELHKRISVLGYMAAPKDMPKEHPLPQQCPGPDVTPEILAISWGQGNPQKDAITIVFLDEVGRLREHTQIDNLFESEPRREFLDIIRRRRPKAIVVGGFSIHTMKLQEKVKEMLEKESGIVPSEVRGDDENSGWGGGGGGGSGWGEGGGGLQDAWLGSLPVSYVSDEVARIFQHSKRAADEFSALSPIGRYCVGLARYAQSPLLEYASLGGDLPAITFDEDAQQLVPREKLLIALERRLVDVVNYVGVDINRAVNEAYYYHLLPFVAGLGPRKAQHLKKKIAAIGGTLLNREQFVKVMTKQIFMNTAGFLRIPQDPDFDPRDSKRPRHDDVSDSPDALDQTRVHPEDYELARKMATDALDMDEEDVKDEHPSHVISMVIADKNKEKKLSELSLDEFADNLMESSKESKRHTLDCIKNELLNPFSDGRHEFRLPSHWEIVTMLTSETQKSLRIGLIVSVMVTRIKDNYVHVRLASGIDGIINWAYLAETPMTSQAEVEKIITKGQTLPAVIIHVKDDRNIAVELSSRPTHIAAGDAEYRRVRPEEEFYDQARAERDREILQRRKRHETGQARRVLKHPMFHNFNSQMAEEYLARQPRGDVVIRPSSKGASHLAVTWKVDHGLYQHIDVTEVDGDGSANIAGRLVVDETYSYSDLDELIVNHVKAMARRVDDLMAHEKFKPGTQEDLEHFLREYVKAYPTKSIYAFSLNRQRPGHFNISFLANKDSQIITWPVKVTPQFYQLFDSTAPSVPQLTDAFKLRHLHETTKAAAGGKTPYGAGLGMTPAGGRTPGGRTPGHATPGRMSIRQPGRTPNPYAPAPPGPGSMGPPPLPGVYSGHR